MPYKCRDIKLPPEYDRRRKLTDEQRDEICHKYKTGEYSLNKLATEYGVSKKLILLTVNPESKRKNDERIKDHWRDYAPDKEKRNEIAREHRAYKQELYLAGKIR